jgi:hypothetical protein
MWPSALPDLRRRVWVLACVLLLALAGCTSPREPRLWFAGFAMNDSSSAFQGDLQLADERFTSLGAPMARYEFANVAGDGAPRWPVALESSLADTFEHIGAQAKPDDIVVVLISTHGGETVLSIQAGGRELGPLTATRLAELLAPLGDTPTVLLLSACYSGSLIPALQRDNRIVLTAAAADRSSYGCHTESRNTFFVDELLAKGFDPDESLMQAMERAKGQIAQREAQQDLKPSMPQMWVGPKVAWLAARPMKDWFAP